MCAIVFLLMSMQYGIGESLKSNDLFCRTLASIEYLRPWASWEKFFSKFRC